ncbi:MAG: hypothetical protein ACTH4C_08720, partial [Psychrobacter celer]
LESGKLIKTRVKTTKQTQGFKDLQQGVDSRLNNLGYKKPLIPYWTKRLLLIVVIMAGLFWILWRVFG